MNSVESTQTSPQELLDQVVLVNKRDEEIGVAPKLQAHEQNLLHRAFSVLLFNSGGEMLIQRRSNDKYHSAGLWSNSCCSHPRPGETLSMAAERRLEEELGLACSSLSKVFEILYQVPFENGLFEHELDHILIGRTDCTPVLNLKEISAWRWISVTNLKQEMKDEPNAFTYWFHLIMDQYDDQLPISLS